MFLLLDEGEATMSTMSVHESVESGPSLDELLRDPIAQLVMRRDGIDESIVRQVIHDTNCRLRNAAIVDVAA